jgi:hypothetical protein
MQHEKNTFVKTKKKKVREHVDVDMREKGYRHDGFLNQRVGIICCIRKSKVK